MTLEEAKDKINLQIETIRTLLSHRHIQVAYDDVLEREVLYFNGCGEYETLSDGIIGAGYYDLVELIDFCFLHELSLEKRSILVSNLIWRVRFDEYHVAPGYRDAFDRLDDVQKEVLKQFEALQDRLASDFSEKLTEKYLSEKSFDKSTIAKFVWKGSQKELGELFFQLKEKGWIDTGANQAAFYRTLDTIFEVPGSSDLTKNLKDYFTRKEISPYGIFKVLPPNVLK